MNKNIPLFSFLIILLLSSIYFAYFSEKFSLKTIILENQLDSSFKIIPYNPFSYAIYLNSSDKSSSTMILFSKDYQNGIVILDKNNKINKAYLLHDMATFSISAIDVNVLKAEQNKLYKLIK